MGFPSEPELVRQPFCFQPCQIVCLEYQTSRLYAEVVQVVEQRKLCWVRPLVLVVDLLDLPGQNTELLPESRCYDLRQGADLLWPLHLFRAALDTEVLPLLTYLNPSDTRTTHGKSDQVGQQQFRQFVQRVWQAHPEAF